MENPKILLFPLDTKPDPCHSLFVSGKLASISKEDRMKFFRWLDRLFDCLGMKLADYYLRNFCFYK